MTVLIKPHHFIDIIKLYGSGIKVFTPNLEYGHDFYKVANNILGDKETRLILTINEDDICKPCKYIDNNGVCIDSLSNIEGISSKDIYNKMLDKRIIKLYNLSLENEYTALELCTIISSKVELLLEVWKEEDNEKLNKRVALFVEGAEKFIV